jgi:glycosyltransferase involved in cell wall biosynthesis
MTRILFIAPGDNSHTWKWVGWFGKKYPGEIALLPYQAPAPKDMLPGVEILKPFIPPFKIASIGSWTLFGKIKKRVHDLKPKLLHVLWAYGAGSYGARSAFKPTILSPWGSDITIFPRNPGVKGAIQKLLIVEALEKADYLTATSKFLQDAIHRLVPSRPVPDLFHYGVDTSVFDPDKVDVPMKFPWPDGAPLGDRTVTVGFFKALKPKYGPDFLIDSLAMAARKVPGIRLIMAGTGEMKDQLVEQATSLEIENRIVFPGRIPYDEMPRALAAVDIFTMPSRYEELGVAALEASAMRKPVVITKKWGMSEVALEGETGLYIAPGDIDLLRDHIVKLAHDIQFRTRLGNAGREFVQGKFEFEKIMQDADRYCTDIIEKFS